MRRPLPFFGIVGHHQACGPVPEMSADRCPDMSEATSAFHPCSPLLRVLPPQTLSAGSARRTSINVNSREAARCRSLVHRSVFVVPLPPADETSPFLLSGQT